MEERNSLVANLLSNNETQPTPRYLEILANYILDAMPKKEKREAGFLTENRLITIHKHETSLEGLMDKFENNEDGVYNLFGEADKNRYLTPKIEITAADIAEVPGLADLIETMRRLEARIKVAVGRDKFILKKTLIEKRREQYILKNAYRAPMNIIPFARGGGGRTISLDEKRWINKNGEPESNCLVNLFKEDHIFALLVHFPILKESTAGQHENDFLYLVEEFEALVTRALQSEHAPLLEVTLMKWDNRQNVEIREMLLKKYNAYHTVEYISYLWRTKIPKIIAQQAREDYLVWHYTYVDPDSAEWKICSRCGQTKLAHSYFFSKNNTAKSGYYSICKKCRNKKKR